MSRTCYRWHCGSFTALLVSAHLGEGDNPRDHVQPLEVCASQPCQAPSILSLEHLLQKPLCLLAPVGAWLARRAVSRAPNLSSCRPVGDLGISGDGAAAASRERGPRDNGTPAREGCGRAPGCPACLPAGRTHYLHQRAGQASRTKLARAKQMSPFSAAED